jgi:tetratricopeptide (TPR) repeat protein
MPFRTSSRRLGSLAVAAVLLCAAAPDAPPQSPPSRSNRYQASGAYGAFLDARFATVQGDLDIAAAAYLRALEADPRNVDLLQPAFAAALLAGRPEAVSLARRLPDVQAAQLLMANQEINAGNWDKAEQRIRALPRQGAMQAMNMLITAWILQGAGKTDAALALLRPHLENPRERGVYALHAALINDMASRTAEAARLYAIVQKDAGPLNLRLAQIIASWQSRQGQVSDATQTLRALGESGEDLPVSLPVLLANASRRPVGRAADGVAETYLTIAAVISSRQDGGETTSLLLRLALDLRPDFTPARLLLSEILEGGKRWSAATQILAPITPDDPLSGMARFRRAMLAERMGQTEEALAGLDQLARDYPDSPLAYAQSGDILRGKHRFSDAVAAYDRAIARNGGPRRNAWTLYYARGIAHDRSGAWAKAERDLQRALEMVPDHPYVLNYLGYSWADQGRNLPKARALLEKAMERKPNDGAITDSLGWVLFRQGDTSAAIRMLERAVELQPTDAVINSHLGDAYWAAGRKREAQFQWRRALLFNPDPDDKVKLEAKLQEHGNAIDAPAERAVQ